VPPHSHDHEVGGSSVVPSAAPPSIDPALDAILQSLTQQQAHLAAELARQAAIQQQMFERMLSMFQTIQDHQDTLQQQLLADMAEHQTFMTHILQHTGVSIPPM
jgi:predicted DsbA family dithiol-disulfide isomerase